MAILLVVAAHSLPASEPPAGPRRGGDEDKGLGLAVHYSPLVRSPTLASSRGQPRQEEMIMTQDKALKNAIRARMAASGEPYAEARRVVLSESFDGGERGGAEQAARSDAASGPDDDYYARYAKEAREAGVPEAEITARLQAMAAEERARYPADDAQAVADLAQQAADRAQDAADRAEELAEQAEELADQAEERAGLAQEAAELAEEWADSDEKLLAQQRAGGMQERSEQAR